MKRRRLYRSPKLVATSTDATLRRRNIFRLSLSRSTVIDPSPPLQPPIRKATHTDSFHGSGSVPPATNNDPPPPHPRRRVPPRQDSILDIPPSWVRQLTLDRDLLALRYPPRGQRTIMYRRTKAELFAENVHPEGTTMRLTLYKVIG